MNKLVLTLIFIISSVISPNGYYKDSMGWHSDIPNRRENIRKMDNKKVNAIKAKNHQHNKNGVGVKEALANHEKFKKGGQNFNKLHELDVLGHDDAKDKINFI